MTSYASVDRIESNFAVCEVELVSFEESRPEDFATKDVTMMEVSLQEFPNDIGEVKEGDVLLVQHDGQDICLVYYKDEEEKARRLEILIGIMR